jgi:hypothetical protein
MAIRQPGASSARCVYASVAAPNGEILVERSLTGGNASHLCQRILFKLDKSADRAGGRRSYSMGQDGFTFRFLWGPGGYTFSLLERGLDAEAVWATAGRIRSRWEAQFGEVRALPVPVSEAARFEPALDELLHEAQHQARLQPARQSQDQSRSALDAGNDELGAVNAKLGEVKSVMADSIEKVLERGDRIELLVDRAERLEQNAVQFSKGSTALRRDLRWRSIRRRVLMGAVVLGAVLLVLSSVCGGPSSLADGCGLRTALGAVRAAASSVGGGGDDGSASATAVPLAAAQDGFTPVDA